MRTDAERSAVAEVLIQIVNVDVERLRLTVDVDPNASCASRTVVGHHDVVPAVRSQFFNRLDANTVIEPAADEVGLDLAAFETLRQMTNGLPSEIESLYFFSPANDLLIYAPRRPDDPTSR